MNLVKRKSHLAKNSSLASRYGFSGPNLICCGKNSNLFIYFHYCKVLTYSSFDCSWDSFKPFQINLSEQLYRSRKYFHLKITKDHENESYFLGNINTFFTWETSVWTIVSSHCKNSLKSGHWEFIQMGPFLVWFLLARLESVYSLIWGSTPVPNQGFPGRGGGH